MWALSVSCGYVDTKCCTSLKSVMLIQLFLEVFTSWRRNGGWILEMIEGSR